jgi:hypothetical protein
MTLNAHAIRYARVLLPTDTPNTCQLHNHKVPVANMAKEGVKQYYQAKIEECELTINEKTQNLRRLEAQRNALNAKGNGFGNVVQSVNIELILTDISTSSTT